MCGRAWWKFCWFGLECKCQLGAIANGVAQIFHILAGFLTSSSITKWGVLNSPTKPAVACQRNAPLTPQGLPDWWVVASSAYAFHGTAEVPAQLLIKPSLPPALHCGHTGETLRFPASHDHGNSGAAFSRHLSLPPGAPFSQLAPLPASFSPSKVTSFRGLYGESCQLRLFQ